MKKLLLSAFALSLTLYTQVSFCQSDDLDEFLGSDVDEIIGAGALSETQSEGSAASDLDILPKLEGPQKFSPRDLHADNPEWLVSDKQVELDKEPLKGQTYSMIPWSEQDPEKWLSIEHWIVERKYKDQVINWKMHIRDIEHQELIGKILQCRGTCEIFRGTKPVNGTHLSRLLEGDEIKTGKDSLAWLFLMDGSLVRLGAETSLTLQEVNISKKEVFYLARLNNGHVFWSTRNHDPMKYDEDPETDSYSLPLMIRDANQEYYERQIYHAQNDQANVSGLVTFNENAIKAQIHKINELKLQNKTVSNFSSKVLMVAPNGSFIAENASFDLLYQSAGNAYFKQRDSNSGQIDIQSRGYLNNDLVRAVPQSWYTISANGRDVNLNEDPSADILISELLTKRIKSIELAREIWISSFTVPLLSSVGDSKKLATEFGYNSWGEETAQRQEFLIDFSRRLETTQLKSIEVLVSKLEASGKSVKKEPSGLNYQASLNHYLLGLKKRYTNKKIQVREMSNLQYYVWILRNGKL